MTNEPSVMSLSEIATRPSLEFKASIENVTFPFVSPDKTVVVNVAPSKASNVHRCRSGVVIILSAFAKLLPELLVILSDVTPIWSASTNVPVMSV